MILYHLVASLNQLLQEPPGREVIEGQLLRTVFHRRAPELLAEAIDIKKNANGSKFK